MKTTGFYRVCHAFFYPIFKAAWPFAPEGLENLPADQPCLLCPNHTSAVDPIQIALCLSGDVPLRIMAKKELMDTPLLGWFLSNLGVFGVDRENSDLAALRTSIKAVRDGANLMIFPEGTRVKQRGEVPAKSGVAIIALRTGAPMVPVYVGEGRKLFRRSRIIFGKPYTPESASRRATPEEYQQFADEVLRRAYALGDEA